MENYVKDAIDGLAKQAQSVTGYQMPGQEGANDVSRKAGRYLVKKFIPNVYTGFVNLGGGILDGALQLPSFTAGAAAYLPAVVYHGVKNLATGVKNPLSSANSSALGVGREVEDAVAGKGLRQMRRVILNTLRQENFDYLKRNDIDPSRPDAYDFGALAGIGLTRAAGEGIGMVGSPSKLVGMAKKAPAVAKAVQGAKRMNPLGKSLGHALKWGIPAYTGFNGVENGTAGPLRAEMIQDYGRTIRKKEE